MKGGRGVASPQVGPFLLEIHGILDKLVNLPSKCFLHLTQTVSQNVYYGIPVPMLRSSTL